MSTRVTILWRTVGAANTSCGLSMQCIIVYPKKAPETSPSMVLWQCICKRISVLDHGRIGLLVLVHCMATNSDSKGKVHFVFCKGNFMTWNVPDTIVSPSTTFTVCMWTGTIWCLACHGLSNRRVSKQTLLSHLWHNSKSHDRGVQWSCLGSPERWTGLLCQCNHWWQCTVRHFCPRAFIDFGVCK